MSFKLGGLPSLPYLGVEASTPPQLLYLSRRPTANDSRNVNPGTFWMVNTPGAEELWVLLSVPGGVATWVQLYPSSAGGASQFDANVGSANELLGVINIIGASDGAGNTGVRTTGAGNTITINTTPIGYTTDDANTVTPIADVINIFGAGGITTSSAAGTVTITGGASSINSVVTDSGTATPVANVLQINAGLASEHAGSSVFFDAPGATNVVRLNVTDANSNTIIGEGSGNATITGSSNVGLGLNTLIDLTGGVANTAIGGAAGASITTGFDNTFIGRSAGQNLITGDDNIAVGFKAANNYSGAESDNIIIGNAGVNGESNTIRIGTQGTGSGQQNSAYMAGIYGSTVGGTNAFVKVDNTGKLGTTTAGVGSLVLLQTEIANNSPTISFINLSSYNTYLLTFSNVSVSLPNSITGQQRIHLGISDDNGVSYSYTIGGGNPLAISSGGYTATFTTAPSNGISSGQLLPGVVSRFNTTQPIQTSGQIWLYGLNSLIAGDFSYQGSSTGWVSVGTGLGGVLQATLLGFTKTGTDINAIQLQADTFSDPGITIWTGTFSLYGLVQ